MKKYFEFLKENLLIEKKIQDKKYDCIMFYCQMNEKDWNPFLKEIKIEDLNENEGGLEEEPHITLLYGIHADEVDKEKVYESLKNIYEFDIETEKVDLFENEKFDVVKLNVNVTDKLKELRGIYENLLPNTQTFEGYHPHLTIAYVKPGEGKKYKRKLDEPLSLKVNKVVYSDVDYNKKYFTLKKIQSKED
jgi:2'-5' RNA ligase